jgi:tRNA A-37 threonylcarbamoyl transferase component Bud32
MIFLFFGTAIFMMVIGQSNPEVYKIVIAFFKWILIPVKPFVVGSGAAQASWIFSVLTTGGQIINWIMVPGVVYLAFRAARGSYLIGIQDRSLVITPVNTTKRAAVRRLLLCEIFSITVDRPGGTSSSNDYVVTFRAANGDLHVKWGDIVHAEGRNKFLEIITANFPDVDRTLFEPFKQLPHRQSYTELWLKELSGAPKRDKLTQLTDGTELEDGNYRVVRRAGIGGHGTVYFATSRRLANRMVVLKEFVLPIYPDVRVRRSAAERFQAEATMLSELNHPQIAGFIELFIEDHRAYLVMELVEGTTLKDLISAQGPLPEAEVVALAVQICKVMVYLHEHNPPILHRDLTPDNIMLEESGLIKLIDFSVAEEVSTGVTGSVVGKPNYISPEQFRGKPVTASDVYSFGATLYYLLIGEDPPAITVLHPQMVKEGISVELDAIIAKSTQLNVTNRYASFVDVLNAMEALAVAQRPQLL